MHSHELHHSPLLACATVYTQVIESLPVLELPHPNPPLGKGRELDFPVSPLSKGGIRGVKTGCESNDDCVYTVVHRLRGGVLVSHLTDNRYIQLFKKYLSAFVN